MKYELLKYSPDGVNVLYLYHISLPTKLWQYIVKSSWEENKGMQSVGAVRLKYCFLVWVLNWTAAWFY